MDNLIKDVIKSNPLIRTPKGFVTVFDKWREDEGKKNNTEISRSDGFKVIEKIMPLLSLDVKTSGLVKRKNKEINLKIK